MKDKIKLCQLDELEIKKPAPKLVKGLDLVLIRDESSISVLYGRVQFCL